MAEAEEIQGVASIRDYLTANQFTGRSSPFRLFGRQSTHRNNLVTLSRIECRDASPIKASALNSEK